MAAEGSSLNAAVRRAPHRHDAPAMSDIFAAMPVAMLIVAPDGTIAEVNPAAEMLLNIGRAALIGIAFDAAVRLQPSLTLPRGEADDAPVRAYGVEVMTMRGLRLRADLAIAPIAGRPNWLTIGLHPVAIAGDRRRGSRSAMGAAAMLAHEIKNPLSGIKGAAQLLERDTGGKGRALTQLIGHEVDRIAALIDRMEDFADARPMPLAAHNLYPLIAHARDLAIAGFARGIAIEEHYDPSLPPVLTNADAMTQVLINLMKNAAEAVRTTAAPSIALHTAYRHGHSVTSRNGAARLPLPIELLVIDNGPGVPPEFADHLFEPFVSSKPTGGGLGLALCDKLIGDMGGTIEFQRERDRSIFRLRLARAQER